MPLRCQYHGCHFDRFRAGSENAEHSELCHKSVLSNGLSSPVDFRGRSGGPTGLIGHFFDPDIGCFGVEPQNVKTKLRKLCDR